MMRRSLFSTRYGGGAAACVFAWAICASTAISLAQETAGKRHALLVGVNEYQHAKLPPLKYAVNDVTELGKVLSAAGYDVTLLTDDAGKKDEKLAPTKASIERHLREIARRCKKGDTLVLALTGHGLQFGGQKDAYYCPIDARPLETATDTLVSVTKVYSELEESFAGAKIVLVDACRNDPTPGRGRGLEAGSAPSPPNGIGVLFSCSAGQRAFEHDSLKHGVFFHYVLEGLRKEAADKKGRVTFDGLQSYVREEVPDKVHGLFPDQKPDQKPNVSGTFEGKPLVLLTLSTSATAPPQTVPKTDKFAGSKAGEEWSDNGLKMKFCWCPSGRFTMGSPRDEKDRQDPEDQVQVTLSQGFWLGKYEVTQKEYEDWVGKNPSFFSSGGLGKDVVAGLDTSACPVEQVTWADAVAFCGKLTDEERRSGRLPAGWRFTLPTEAQWEYACRAGTRTVFAFGDSLSSEQANFNGDYPYGEAAKGRNLERTTSVGRYASNAWGLHDMHGNVHEWCRDWFKTMLPGGTDPEVTEEASHRLSRGGSWNSFGGLYCRSAGRERFSPDHADYRVGFRVALVQLSK
jgi:formylglycine-generating enzyme required for sulfatase activity